MSTYYNEEQKYAYIESSSSKSERAITVLSACFEGICPYEVEAQKDFCEFTTDEVKNAINNMHIESVSGVDKFFYNLFGYVDWCVQNGYVESNNMNGLVPRRDLYTSAIQNGLINEAQLLVYARQLKNPCNRFLLMAPFYGFSCRESKGDDYKGLTEQSFDFDNMRVIINENRIIDKVPMEFLSYGVASAKTYKMVPEYQTNSLNSGTEYRLFGNGVLKYRSYATLQSTRYFVYNRFAKTFIIKFGKVFSLPNVTKSGIVHFAREAAIETGIFNAGRLFQTDAFRRDVIERFEISPKSKQKYVRLIENYIKPNSYENDK